MPALANPVASPVDVVRSEASVIVEKNKPQESAQAVQVSLRPSARTIVIPKARWGTGNGRSKWTLTMIKAMRSHASNIPKIVPRDIASWCPAYPTASRADREAFWVGLVSSLAWHESTHRPAAVGGGGKWYGLTQIYPDTARRYQCRARTGDALKDPHDNLSCALRIMAVTVQRDQVVSAGMRGVAADWGPFHSSRKREDMRAWTRKQPYCSALGRSLKPVARPEHLGGAPDTLPVLNVNEVELTRPHSRPSVAAGLKQKNSNPMTPRLMTPNLMTQG